MGLLSVRKHTAGGQGVRYTRRINAQTGLGCAFATSQIGVDIADDSNLRSDYGISLLGEHGFCISVF